MPCINDNNNGHFTGPYYPRPFFLLPETQSGSNNVVNPARSEEWGFFVGTASTVAAGAQVPIAFSSGQGTAITGQSANVANITTGSYHVTYSITASSSTNPMQFGVELGGTLLPFTTITAAGDGADKSISASFFVTAPANTTLEIVNLTAGTANVTRALLTVTKVLN